LLKRELKDQQKILGPSMAGFVLKVFEFKWFGIYLRE